MHSCGTETLPVSAVPELISIAARLYISPQTCCQDMIVCTPRQKLKLHSILCLIYALAGCFQIGSFGQNFPNGFQVSCLYHCRKSGLFLGSKLFTFGRYIQGCSEGTPILHWQILQILLSRSSFMPLFSTPAIE